MNFIVTLLSTITLGLATPLTTFLDSTPSAGDSLETPLLTLNYIPAGQFTMGSPASEQGRRSDENQVEVTLTSPFLMATTEVSQGLWLAIMGQTIDELIASKADPLGRGANLKNYPSATGPDQPMCFVSYFDCLEFCQKLTAQYQADGLIPADYHFTLPTEAQWEFAARAGTQTVFSIGNVLTSNDANFYGKMPYGTEVKGEYREKTTPIKSFAPTPWGLYDIHGNVYEWCLDWYTEELTGGTNPAEMTTGDSRCIRGGPWNRKATSLRSAYRYSYDPTQRTNNIGFRVVLQKQG